MDQTQQAPQQTFPTSLEIMAARYEVLGYPAAVRILGALLTLQRGNTSSLQKHFAGGDESEEKQKEMAALYISIRLPEMAEAGLLVDLTPEKKKYKEYAIANDGHAIALAQWANWMTGGR